MDELALILTLNRNYWSGGTRASPPPERPLRGLPGGILPEFPCLWSWTTVAWSVPAFLPRKPSVGAPLLSAMVALGPPDPLLTFSV